MHLIALTETLLTIERMDCPFMSKLFNVTKMLFTMHDMFSIGYERPNEHF